MFATLARLYGKLLCSMLTYVYFSKARIFHMAIENGELLIWSCLPINRANVKLIDMCVRILRNGVRMETVAPQNDHATEQNINFLLQATLYSSLP